MITTVIIDNTDNKLTQQEWALFCEDLHLTLYTALVRDTFATVQFAGSSDPTEPWQNRCMVLSWRVPDIDEPLRVYFNQRWAFWMKALRKLCADYHQDSVALIEGDSTQFITPTTVFDFENVDADDAGDTNP